MTAKAFLAALLLLAPRTALAFPGETDALASATTDFYRVYIALHPSDGIPDAKERTKFAPVVSPALDKLFAEGEAAEVRYAQATKHQSPPLVEGDPFTANFEGATALEVSACAVDARGGHCSVQLAYDDRREKPRIWADTVILVRTSSG